MKSAFVFPGQGSQSLGMLSAAAEAWPMITETFDEASNVLGYDLWHLCQHGPAEELNKTMVTQPALLTASVALWRQWCVSDGPRPDFVAGHSLGEYSALVAAAQLSHRYITDRFLPDKAIDLIDEAASRLRMEVDSKPEELDALDRQILQMQIEQEALRKEDDAASREHARIESEMSGPSVVPETIRSNFFRTLDKVLEQTM